MDDDQVALVLGRCKDAFQRAKTAFSSAKGWTLKPKLRIASAFRDTKTVFLSTLSRIKQALFCCYGPDHYFFADLERLSESYLRLFDRLIDSIQTSNYQNRQLHLKFLEDLISDIEGVFELYHSFSVRILDELLHLSHNQEAVEVLSRPTDFTSETDMRGKEDEEVDLWLRKTISRFRREIRPTISNLLDLEIPQNIRVLSEGKEWDGKLQKIENEIQITIDAGEFPEKIETFHSFSAEWKRVYLVSQQTTLLSLRRKHKMRKVQEFIRVLKKKFGDEKIGFFPVLSSQACIEFEADDPLEVMKRYPSFLSPLFSFRDRAPGHLDALDGSEDWSEEDNLGEASNHQLRDPIYGGFLFGGTLGCFVQSGQRVYQVTAQHVVKHVLDTDIICCSTTGSNKEFSKDDVALVPFFGKKEDIINIPKIIDPDDDEVTSQYNPLSFDFVLTEGSESEDDSIIEWIIDEKGKEKEDKEEEEEKKEGFDEDDDDDDDDDDGDDDDDDFDEEESEMVLWLDGMTSGVVSFDHCSLRGDGLVEYYMGNSDKSLTAKGDSGSILMWALIEHNRNVPFALHIGSHGSRSIGIPFSHVRQLIKEQCGDEVDFFFQ